MTESTRQPNRLLAETSPYLRQHAYNPVDWYPWGAEALERARREDRPIFLSIGYSACHWCHVMERESFENPEIASLMNALFVNIKVDREERPDLDRIYMSAVQMMTGSGGWPMSVFLTPDLKPFYGGTYFPPDDRYGRPGFGKILAAVAEAYRTRRDEVEQSSAQILQQIESVTRFSAADSLLSPVLLDRAFAEMNRRFDSTNGGFGSAPKFPQALGLQLLLRQNRRAGEIQALQIVRQTLDRMAAGGIHDQIGGGFHRYSTDQRWLVPHFEKMLYDNALLAVTYLEAYQVTGDPSYADVVRGILGFLRREMTSPDGGLYSTLDADSEGEEGIYYLWTPAALREVLSESDAELFARAYDVDDVGNFEGRSILHRVKSDDELASIFALPPGGIADRLARARAALYAARQKRVAPHRDEKVLADWNALAITAFARAYRVLGDPEDRKSAERAGEFLLSRLRGPDGGLLHCWTAGEAKIPAFLEDHAGLLVAWIDLYEATGQTRWLNEARQTSATIAREFGDAAAAGFFDTSAKHGDVIVRTKHGEDGSVPSGNSLAATGCLRLARITGDDSVRALGERTLRAFAPLMEAAPMAADQMLIALDLHLSPPREIAFIGPWDAEATGSLRAIANRLFLPNTVLLHGTGNGPALLDGLEGKATLDGKPTAYVCSNFACKAPVTTPADLEGLLRRGD